MYKAERIRYSIGFMHRGPIVLPESLQARCIALLSLGAMLRLYSINTFIRVADVEQKLLRNKLTICDLQDIRRLCSEISRKGEVNARNRRTERHAQRVHCCGRAPHSAVRHGAILGVDIVSEICNII